MATAPNTEKDFWRQTKLLDNGCLIWTGGLGTYRYGRFTLKPYGRMDTHRLAWILNRGAIPNDLHVLHSCDNRRCVNIEHLFLGTNLDNVKDKLSKGRQEKGEQHHNSKLTIYDIKSIKLLSIFVDRKEIAYIFDVGLATIYDVLDKRTWTYVPNFSIIEAAEAFQKYKVRLKL